MIDKATPINVIRFDVNPKPYITQGSNSKCILEYDLGKSKTTGQIYLVIHCKLVEVDAFSNTLINYYSEKVCTLNITSKHKDFIALIDYLNNYYFEIALAFEERLPNITNFNFGDVKILLSETAKKIINSLTNLGAYNKHPQVLLNQLKAIHQRPRKTTLKKMIN
ncbi:MAG: hypothetical protein WC622_13740 [Pedobacter sp.]|uniref:hypothetical protein n=1 Tax=Pedobacter sp. TaxID=1411316 RepID=UPI003563C2D8